MTRDGNIWSVQMPWNFRTAVFCFLAGAVWSLPASLLWSAVLVRFTPDWAYDAYDAYEILVAISILLLPIWSLMGVRRYGPLPTVGLVLWWVFIALGICAVCFPEWNLVRW